MRCILIIRFFSIINSLNIENCREAVYEKNEYSRNELRDCNTNAGGKRWLHATVHVSKCVITTILWCREELQVKTTAFCPEVRTLSLLSEEHLYHKNEEKAVTYV